MDLKWENILPGAEKSACLSPAPVLETKIECPTPEKITDPLPTKLREGRTQLPQK